MEHFVTAAIAMRHPSVEESDGRWALEHFIPTAESVEKLSALLEAFGEDLERGYEGLVRVVRLSELPNELRIRPAKNWHYDRATGFLLVNLRRGKHESLMATLNYLYTGQRLETAVASETYLNDGRGWFKSTASLGRALKGHNVRLSPTEARAFCDFEFYEN